jgi:Tol biopolymer transport system component
MKLAPIILLSFVATPLIAQQPRLTGPRLVGTAALKSESGTGPSYLPTWCGDGRYLFFLSAAENLVTNHLQKSYLNVCRYDPVLEEVTLVSFNGSALTGANENCGHIVVSSNGMLAAFETFANNLYPADTNRALDVYLADLNGGSIQAINLDRDGALPASGGAGRPRISANGRYVAFESSATNLTEYRSWSFQRAIFLRDRQSSNTALINVPVTGEFLPYNASRLYDLTPDGRFVVFTSPDNNLVTNSTVASGEHIYVRDHLNGITHQASENVLQLLPDLNSPWRCFNPVLTSDGHFCAFKVSNISSVLIIFHDLESRTSSLVTSNASLRGWLQLNASGSTLVYEEANQIYSWDRDTHSTRLLSWNSSGTGPANAPSRSPILTLDGAKFAFASSATDLSPDATNGVFQIYARDLISSNTYLITQTTNGQPSARSHELKMFSWHPDGSRIAFESDDSSLVPKDWNGSVDVFVRDLDQSHTTLISKTHSERRAKTGIAPLRLGDQSITADGRKAVFSSYDNVLDFDDANHLPNALIVDLLSGKATLLLPPANELGVPTGTIYPSLSSDGRYAVFAVFQSGSPFERRYFSMRITRKDLITGALQSIDMPSPEGNGAFGRFFSMSADARIIAYQGYDVATQIYVRDFALGTDVPMLPRTNETPHSYRPLVSPDGTAVLFESDAGNIITSNAVFGVRSLFLRELTGGTTLLLSTDADGRATWGSTDTARFSATSQFLVFPSGGRVLVHDRLTQSNSVVCQQCARPSISADGIWVAYESSGQPRQIQVKNRQTGAAQLLSQRTNGQPANLDSSTPLITHNGEFVVFLSPASDLIAGDTNSYTDLFIGRLTGNDLLRIEGPIINPVLGPDGRTVLFQSASSALTQNDYNALPDLFVLRLGAADEDNDLLPDDWELAYFNSLSRDGSGDYDSDGHSDLQEFTAGTDPTNQNSVFRILGIISSGGIGRHLFWSSVPERLYRIEFKSTTSDLAWHPLPGFVRAVDSTASTIDPSVESGSRVYRAVFVP